jgi:hydroxymethylglutaryl-CoA reductase
MAEPTIERPFEGFYKLSPEERLTRAARARELSPSEMAALANFGSLGRDLTTAFVENAVGTLALPLGIATNFLIDGREVLVPMAVEESSVIAAASHGAKLARSGGGFTTETSASIMTGQIQIFPADTTPEGVRLAQEALSRHREEILTLANATQERLVSLGGGARDISTRWIPELSCLVLHLDADCKDAMGANTINTMCERIAEEIPRWFSARVGLRILTNLCDKRLVSARCRVAPEALERGGISGHDAVRRVHEAFLFAWHDPYRATTHNKGVMNGIDPVVLATGNDWRAVEAGAHAWAARSGQYRSLTRWTVESDGYLAGHLEIPLALGTVGGVTRLHPTAQASLRLMGSPSAARLAQICASVGLAQNLAALRALAMEGIQEGHMNLHRANLELAERASASPSKVQP